MNKKLIILIVALECVFSIFLISVFGPMVESLHTKVVVKDVYFVNDAGERMEEGATVTVDLDKSRSYHLDFVVESEDATERTVDILCNQEGAVEITPDADGFGFEILFIDKSIPSVTIVIRATDSSQKSASITLSKASSDTDIDDLR